MTPPAFLASLEARGVRLTAIDDRLRVEAPAGVLTAAVRDALAAHKPAILAALRAQDSLPVTTDDKADSVPDGACGLCGHQPLTAVRDWPVSGTARWLCLACAVRPVPSLEAVYASLTPAERQRLVEEARAGDVLSKLLLKLPPAAGAA